jgi:hypothetical protein
MKSITKCHDQKHQLVRAAFELANLALFNGNSQNVCPLQNTSSPSFLVFGINRQNTLPRERERTNTRERGAKYIFEGM